MFWVTTASRWPRRSSSTSARVGAVGLLVLERLEAVAVEVPEALGVARARHRCARPPSGRRSPTARCRASGSRGSRTAPRCPAPVSATTEPASRTRPASSLDAAGLPPAPLRLALAEEGADALAGVLAGEDGGEARPSRPRCPRRGRACAETCLICADRQRRLPGELARPRQRGVEQLVVGHDAVDEAELVGLLGADRRRRSRFISSALFSPTSRGRRCVPPKPGMIPSLISGWPKSADCAAMRTSHAIASSQPPPKARPLTAAIVTTLERSKLAQQPVARRRAARARRPRPSAVKALMSAPAQKSSGFDGGDDQRAHAARPRPAPRPARRSTITCGRDRVHQAVGQPGDRDVAARLELDRLARLLVVGLRVGVEALAGLLAEAALGDEPAQHRAAGRSARRGARWRSPGARGPRRGPRCRPS